MPEDSHNWNPFSRRPMRRLRALVIASLRALAPMALFSETVSDAWISLTWPSAEAAIFGEPRRDPPRDKRGHAYDVTMVVRLPDGRTAMGRSLKPLFDEIVPPGPSGQTTRRVSPHVGERPTVRYNASDPTRMAPERELLRAFELAVIVHCALFGALCRLFYMLFRRSRPRL